MFDLFGKKTNIINEIKNKTKKLSDYEDYLGDKDVVLEAVKVDGLQLADANYILQMDKDVIDEAIKQNVLAYRYAKNKAHINNFETLKTFIDSQWFRRYLKSYNATQNTAWLTEEQRTPKHRMTDN